MIVVTHTEVPYVTVNLVVPGGSAADPPGRAGVAELTAGLLTKGSATRSAMEIAGAVDHLGAVLEAAAAPDWTNVTLGVLRSGLDVGLELMSDVVMDPSFPREELELLRDQKLAQLRIQLGQPQVQAERALTRELFGEHPYGVLETPESVERIGRSAVVEHHRASYRPERALFVVAGDVSADEITAALEEHFGAWRASGSAPPPGYPPPTALSGPEIVLVHKPGSVQAVIRLGALLPRGAHQAWTALQVANEVLGGGSGRLFQVLREEKGWTYGAYSGPSRRVDVGGFMVGLEVRNQVADSALAELLNQLELMGSESVPSDELEGVKDFLIGSFPLRIETPQQIADQVTTNILLGVPADAIETYRSRVAGLEPEEIQRVSRAYFDPGRAAVVVVGDALELRAALARVAPVRILDLEGNPVSPGDLEIVASSVVLDASILTPGRWTYRLSVQGQVIGEMTREVAEVETEAGPAMTVRSLLSAGGQMVEQEVLFEPVGFTPLVASVRMAVGGREVGGSELRFQGGRVTGVVRRPTGEEQSIDRQVPPGTLVGEMQGLAVWLADLDVGTELRFPVVSSETGALTTVTIRVLSTTEVSTPAGTFDAYEIEASSPLGSQRILARVEAPHVILRVESVGQPVVVELTSLPGRTPLPQHPSR